MKFNKIINYIIVTVAAVFLTTLAFHVNAKTDADSIAILKTTGMTCGSCSSKIIAALERQKGVVIAEVDVAGGWVIVGYDTKSIKPEALAANITDTGFNSNVHLVMSPAQFKQTTGRSLGKKAEPVSSCCGAKGGGCGAAKKI